MGYGREGSGEAARRDERRAAALLTICGFKRLRQQLVLYILKILKSSAGSSTARKPFQKASETRTARVSVSCSGLHADGADVHASGRVQACVSRVLRCPCHPCVHAIRSCVRASRLCACHEHTRMERVHARMEINGESARARRGLPYGCLLFMYRLDLTCVYARFARSFSKRKEDRSCEHELVTNPLPWASSWASSHGGGLDRDF
jgi:hypothetical protein